MVLFGTTAGAAGVIGGRDETGGGIRDKTIRMTPLGTMPSDGGVIAV